MPIQMNNSIRSCKFISLLKSQMQKNVLDINGIIFCHLKFCSLYLTSICSISGSISSGFRFLFMWEKLGWSVKFHEISPKNFVLYLAQISILFYDIEADVVFLWFRNTFSATKKLHALENLHKICICI
jgi:hypothetical protein